MVPRQALGRPTLNIATSFSCQLQAPKRPARAAVGRAAAASAAPVLPADAAAAAAAATAAAATYPAASLATLAAAAAAVIGGESEDLTEDGVAGEMEQQQLQQQQVSLCREPSGRGSSSDMVGSCNHGVPVPTTCCDLIMIGRPNSWVAVDGLWL